MYICIIVSLYVYYIFTRRMSRCVYVLYICIYVNTGRDRYLIPKCYRYRVTQLVETVLPGLLRRSVVVLAAGSFRTCGLW